MSSPTPPYPGFGQQPYPGNGFPMPQPPKKTRWGLIAAALAASIGLAVSGAYVYGHFFEPETSTSTAASKSSETDHGTSESPDASRSAGSPTTAGGGNLAPPAADPSGRSRAPAPGTGPGQYEYPAGRSEQYRLFAVLLNESSIHLTGVGEILKQGHMVCESLGQGGDFSTASNSIAARNDADGAIVRTVASVVSVQMFCPQFSPVGDSRGASMTPNNPDQDGEMFNRLQGVGIRISDLPNVSRVGQQVCSTLAGDPDNYPAAYSMVENSGLGLDHLRSQFFTIIAHQAYCPSK